MLRSPLQVFHIFPQPLRPHYRPPTSSFVSTSTHSFESTPLIRIVTDSFYYLLDNTPGICYYSTCFVLQLATLPCFPLEALSSVDSVPGVYPDRIGALKSPSNTSSLSPAAPSLFSLFCKKSAKLTSSISNPYALFKKECFANFFTISDFRTLLQNTRCVPISSAQRLPIFSTASPLCTHSNARNPFSFNRLLHSSLFTHIPSLSLPFAPRHQPNRQLPPNVETSCQLPPS